MRFRCRFTPISRDTARVPDLWPDGERSARVLVGSEEGMPSLPVFAFGEQPGVTKPGTSGQDAGTVVGERIRGLLAKVDDVLIGRIAAQPEPPAAGSV
ncbi:unannotated protein [freshwater metagenome]|uniref:Unannotated protein n=1 Tax=freshwater metagenome TaxID=449393 RepID=A0A6J7C6Y7_9ZZZZ